jgi:type IV secretion system protein VirB9
MACASPAPLGPEDFAAATRQLDEPDPLKGSVPPAPATRLDVVPADDPAIQAALRKYQETGEAPVLRDREAGFVVFPFGETEPLLSCRPLRVCEIELEAGEEILDVALGDPTRWHAQPMESGAAESRVPHVIVKPTETGISTNLVISTTRRTYHLELLSTAEDDPGFVRRARFYYPKDMVTRYSAAREHEVRARDEARERVVATGPGIQLENLFFGYELSGTRTPWWPVQVFDDGTHVYIQMPPSMRVTEAPALFVESSEGDASLVNYRVRGSYYVVDKLFSRAALVLGVGSDAQRVTIRRLRPRAAVYGSRVER